VVRDFNRARGAGAWPHDNRPAPPDPYWQERGWIRDGNAYRGNYQTDRAVFSGYVTSSSAGIFHFFSISHPKRFGGTPLDVLYQSERRWYLVHMASSSKDLSRIITMND